jgi:predicted Na+-dependent transporter
MFQFKPHQNPTRVLNRLFLLGLLAVSTMLLAISTAIGSSSTIPSFAVTRPDSAVHWEVSAPELIAQLPAPASPQPSPVPSAPTVKPTIPVSDTALLFQNENYAVRVFREGGQAYANIYNKAQQTHQKVPVSITPAGDPKKDPIKYIATIGDQQYIVTVNPLGASDLTILRQGQIAYQQSSNQVEVARKVPGISEQAQPANPTRDIIKTLFINYAKITLFALMLSLGLRWMFEDVTWLWRQPSLLLRSLFSVLVAVPLLGAIAALIPGLTVAQHIGIGAMVICPGAPMIPLKSLKAGGNPKFIASLQFAVCILAIVTIPLSTLILAQFYPNQAWLSPLEVGKQIFFAQVFPMMLGVMIAQYAPKLAKDLLVPATKIASLMLLLVLIVLLVVTLDDVLTAGFPTYLAIAFMTIASLACGHLLGGPQPGTQTVLAYATATRNAGLAILLVTLNFPELDFVKGGIISTLITYALIAAIVSIPYTTWRKRSLVVETA